MSWWESVIDAVPVVGTGYRTVKAVAAHVSGDHEEAKKQWADAGMNLAGDALGLVTGGAGKIASTAAKVGAKTALQVATKEGVKTVTKQTLKEAAKEGGKAAARAARKQLTKKGMKRYAKKYVKKKGKKAIKKGLKEAALGEEVFILEELHRFSGSWKGFYRQHGTNHEVQCKLIIDLEGNMAGSGNDISRYTVSGKIDSDGKFIFNKHYEGPTCHHVVVYSGSVEWRDQPILQGKWTIPSGGQSDDFVIIAEDLGLEASVISLCCYSSEDVMAMDHHQKRREVIDALSEIVVDMTTDELNSLGDQELINIAGALTIDEDDSD